MKKRIDVALVEQGFFDSREKAKKALMSGIIFVDNQRVDKAGAEIKEGAKIEVRGKTNPYVSRGGYKLEKAMKVFDISLNDKVCMDIGASTGGFTDCMLQNGATKVYSIDVGYGQLAWKLRQDERVVCLERTNIRHVNPDDFQEKAGFASIDVSFISLKLVLPKVYELLDVDGEVVALIKPQFEAGREKVGKKGVVREKSTHIEVIEEVCGYALKNKFKILDLDFSPIKGPEGNIEYLIHLKKIENKDIEEVNTKDIEDFNDNKDKAVKQEVQLEQNEVKDKNDKQEKIESYNIESLKIKIEKLVEESHKLNIN
ncbi:MAG: TlyA family RNA methyltransferase [Clostridioides sp.]|jgi:23S rRNA (cytidine1920-2'-O)/16S rRNA (cytidine1409-2'-O)-methyltransferase|nr:TlyA family RNA methyltransferase [Clostridioides sp.]